MFIILHKDNFTSAHSEQNPSVCVVQSHPVVACWVHELVAGGALHKGSVEVEPVTGDVDCHGQLEEEHAGGVEGGEGGQQAHGGASVCKHVQHCAKFTALTKQAGSMSVNSIQET